jgi:predicted phage terminase large subunit-like protein
MKLTVDQIEAFSGVYLSARYDSPQPTPDFHRACWRRYCSDRPSCATAAPRNHAKSTALTHDYGLATALFRAECYIIIVGSSEDMAIEHLNDIANELRENEDLIRDFRIKEFVVDQKTDIIVECLDGYQFRFIARGAEQKIRGRKWRGQRPGLIIFDDIEDDEQVESRDRRRKFRRWFFRACKQALRDGGKMRGHGTILHEDSLLNHLMKNKEWNSIIYKAHESFDDFSNILWPEKFPESRLRKIRQEFINEGDSAGYSQEYLNDPFDYEDAYLRKEDFIPMSDDDYEVPKRVAVGVDFAISKPDSANRTSFSVGGEDSRNLLHFIDQRVDRLDSLEIVEEFFSIQKRWSPDMFFVEAGQIWNAIEPILIREMQKRGVWISFQKITSTKDKSVRGRTLQKRMRAGGCRFDKEASWYPAFEAELLRFTGTSEALLDDQFDSAGLLALGMEKLDPPEDEDFKSDEEVEFENMAAQLKDGGGRSAVTGY